MKLIYCPECQDLITVHIADEPRKCECGKSWGRYLDRKVADFGGMAIPVGINNNSFQACLHGHNWTFEGMFYAPIGWCQSPNVLKNGEKQYEEDSINMRYLTSPEQLYYMTDFDLQVFRHSLIKEMHRRGLHDG